MPDSTASMYERTELEQSFADGGDGALRSVYDRYGSLVYTFCRRTVGHHDATEVAQDVFVAAWRSQGSYDPSRGGLGGWLIAIARNKAIDHLRRQGRQPAIDPGLWILDVNGTRLVIVATSFPETTARDLATIDEILASIQID